MKWPETNRKHSPFGCPSAPALFLAPKNHMRYQQIAYLLEKWIPLIINYLRTKTHETTGKKPAKTEMNNKQNMNSYTYSTPADRYKNAQPLMVPFDAEEESKK